MKELKLVFLLFILFLIYVFLSAKSYSTFVFNDLEKNVFRLHIVANSNSKEDQYLKLKIRDDIIYFMSDYLNQDMSKEEAIKQINFHKNDICNIIENDIKESGFNYSYSFNIGKKYFPLKSYGSISLPNR